MHNHTPASNEKWYICDQTWAGPEGASKLHEEAAQMAMLSAPTTRPSPFYPAPVTSWGVFCDQLMKEGETQAWFTDGSAWYVSTTESGWL